MLLYSRQREFMADRASALAVGPTLFSNALTNYSVHAMAFDEIAPSLVVKLAVEQNAAPKNVYDMHSKVMQKVEKQELEKIRKEVLKPHRAIFSTHPPISLRLEKIKGAPEKHLVLERSYDSAHSLIKDIHAKEEELTKIFAEQILKNVEIVRTEK